MIIRWDFQNYKFPPAIYEDSEFVDKIQDLIECFKKSYHVILIDPRIIDALIENCGEQLGKRSMSVLKDMRKFFREYKNLFTQWNSVDIIIMSSMKRDIPIRRKNNSYLVPLGKLDSQGLLNKCVLVEKI